MTARRILSWHRAHARELAIFLSILRLAIGTSWFLAPRRTIAAFWMGPGEANWETVAAVRSLGGRDIAMGAGTLVALQQRKGVRSWLTAGALADLSDAVATVLSFRKFAGARAWMVGYAALQGVFWGLWLGSALENDEDVG